MGTLPKIVVILGPTASGKTDLAIALAKKYNGEIISADSRQIYREFSIGTAKPAGEWKGGVYLTEGVPYHLVDCVDPTARYSAADFKRDALRAIRGIIQRGKTPFLVGGTGLYIAAVIDNLGIPDVPPNTALRRSLESRSLAELQALIRALDPRAAGIIDTHNPRRLVRALEVALLSGKSFAAQISKSPPFFEALQIGLSWPKEALEERIKKRLEVQIEKGFAAEAAARWRKYGPAAAPSLSSIGYQPLISYLSGEVSFPEALRLIFFETRRYARRQMTWFKRDARIHWIAGAREAAAEERVKIFLS